MPLQTVPQTVVHLGHDKPVMGYTRSWVSNIDLKVSRSVGKRPGGCRRMLVWHRVWESLVAVAQARQSVKISWDFFYTGI